MGGMKVIKNEEERSPAARIPVDFVGRPKKALLKGA